MTQEERSRRWSSGEGYNRYITNELNSFRKDAWKKQIGDHFEGRKGLEILDVGTGPGFFACILSEEGQHVTGIDASEGMLRCARENAEKLGVHPTFLQMDLNEMTFEDERFDAVVLRNVSWTLQYPEKVYTEFKRVLKPQGILLIYDANWHMHWFDEEIMQRVRERERRHHEKYGTDEKVSGGDLEYFKTAPLTRTWRPQWDIKTLTGLGFDVTVTEDIGRFVYEEWEKELYGESPLFEICAVKKPLIGAKDNMHTYWQGRAESWGGAYTRESLQPLMNRVGRYLPEGRLKVLDVGTGPGAVASSMAFLGHDVTGIDLTSNMIRKAKANAERLGLSIEYMTTAADELPFADDTFDVVISRLVTWALPEPEKTFRMWQRVLKPGGLLIYLDGNCYLYHHDAEEMRNRQLVLEKTGTVHGGEKFDPTLCDDTAYDLPLSYYDRPFEWDNVVLPRLQFDIIAEEIEMPQKLLRYGIYDKGFSSHFLIVAKNGKNLPGQFTQ